MVVALTLCLVSITGTPYTIAPEVFREEEYNEKTDVYSFSIGAFGFAPLMCTTQLMAGFGALSLPNTQCSTSSSRAIRPTTRT